MAERNRSRPTGNGNAGCLFWLGLLLIVLLLFLVNIGKIQETLERTNFRDIMQTQKDSGATKEIPAPKVQPALPEGGPSAAPGAAAPSSAGPGAAKPGATAPAAATPGATAPSGALPPPASKPTAGTSAPGGAATAAPGSAAPIQPAPAKSGAAGGAAKPEASTGSRPAEATPASSAAPRYRDAALFFIHIDDDGIMVRREVRRRVTQSDSPLRDALAALLAGPTAEEIGKGLISLVPKGTSLRSVQVRGATAWIDLSEAFMYNNYGVEGYAGQLKQLVYTATSFPSVQDVQVLIEGEKRDYLGGEGVFIGRPLSRNSF